MKGQNGDKEIGEHIESGPGKAFYLILQIQSEIIAAGGRIN